MSDRIRGPLAPVLTPFTPDLAVDQSRFIAHCKWLIDNHVRLAIFGTNSEAASLSVNVAFYVKSCQDAQILKKSLFQMLNKRSKVIASQQTLRISFTCSVF